MPDEAIANLPVFLRARNLEPFISSELVRSSTPIIFETEKGDGWKLAAVHDTEDGIAAWFIRRTTAEKAE